MEDMYIGKFLDDRYEILEKIGSGGMAVVYKARCHRLNRFVAIKILKSDLAQDPDLRRRFHAESQAVAMLSHPNIVSVYDVNHTDKVDYIVMELIEGITLKQYINKKGILNWKEALHFTTQIVKALEHAHSRGIIHRDIKPHNIMILKDGNVKVADFGIARLLTTQNTLTQETLGSVHYISPEQAKGGQADARSDLYSVGVVMYEMLTSRLPFEGDSAVSIAIQHISSIPLMPREINPDIPVGLEEITMHAMDPNINTRYPSATALLEDLEDFRKNPSIRFNYSFAPSMADDIDDDRGSNYGYSEPVRQPRRNHGNGATRDRVSSDEYRDNRRRAGHNTMLVGIFLVTLLLVALVVFMWKVALRGWLKPEEDERIEIPNFVDKMYDDVVVNPDYRKYFVFERVYDYESEEEEGRIIDQVPAYPRTVTVTDDGILVTLTVSAGKQEEDQVMPDFYNKEYRSARNTLEQLELDLKFDMVEQPSDVITEGYIIEQLPAAGSPLKPGMTITFIYSSGPADDKVPVPDLTGLSESSAMSRLEAYGLKGSVIEEYNDTAPKGRVFFQNYEKDQEVGVGTTIIFYVSLGPEPQQPPVDDNPPSGGDNQGGEGQGGEGQGGDGQGGEGQGGEGQGGDGQGGEGQDDPPPDYGGELGDPGEGGGVGTNG